MEVLFRIFDWNFISMFFYLPQVMQNLSFGEFYFFIFFFMEIFFFTIYVDAIYSYSIQWSKIFF